MASSRLGLVLLLLPAQHRSHGWYPGRKRASSSPLRPPGGRVLETAAGSPAQTACSLPIDALSSPEDKVPRESRTMAQKQHLVQILLVSGVRGPHHSKPPPASGKT
uniref:Gonadoliberin n=1 Tax=Propithecus coquereli TaxID=379532 RepID=A0A2K6FPI1_PROCO